MTAGPAPSAIVAAIGENLREYALLAGCAPTGKSGSGGEITWIDTGTDALNRVLAARYTARRAEAGIRETAAIFGGRPLTWITGPADRPADLGRRLLDHGFRHQMHWRGMALALGRTAPAAAPPAGLEIRQALNPDGIAEWGRTAAAGFAMPERVARDFPVLFASLPTDKIAYFLAYRGSQPVATASVFLGSGGVAGAYFISTLGSARRSGAATALTRALIGHAADRGYRLLVLEASPAGYEVYRRLNFTEYCPMDAYILNM
ncbi:GNAT family N-acetyltransferase [Anaeroselena agilis]|uniref:GNAT family N-acetyltransferase n=1 Tax=Anaeroselena agilis TaxID=3063788 RepID=A0ABU3NY31_9FIRM|nr:GNAT family N-acetyltransferase [Selenomonadales bacterium 4137-cl]